MGALVAPEFTTSVRAEGSSLETIPATRKDTQATEPRSRKMQAGDQGSLGGHMRSAAVRRGGAAAACAGASQMTHAVFASGTFGRMAHFRAEH
jgi:hypothetical protein